MTNDPEERIKALKDEKAELERQVEIIRDALELTTDFASAILKALADNNKELATQKATDLQMHSFNALKTAILAKKPLL